MPSLEVAMTRAALPLLLVAVLVFPGAGQDLEFEVASIKRNTSGDLSIGFGRPPDPANGDVRLFQVPARNLILQAYPLETLPVQIVNLPSWADDRYDVIARGKPGATAAERQQMWRKLLADRMKLAAHYETREQASYDLVIARADKRLGPGIKPSPLDCSSGPSTAPIPAPTGGADFREATLNRCGAFFVVGDSMTSRGVTVANLTRMVTPAAGRPIVDKTGLDGYFEIALRFQRMPSPAAGEPAPDAAPSVFTALQEQLGLRLDPSKTQGQILVIDAIERPTEN
jgi:uncharacterized protein (TIGR03435 family)